MQSSDEGNLTLMNSYGINLTLNSYDINLTLNSFGINFLNVPKQLDVNSR